VEFVLTHDACSRVAQQLVVVEQAAGNGVLDGHHANGGGVALDVLKHLFEGGAADELHLLTVEILVGGHVVERTHKALYRYSLHLSLLHWR